MLTDAQLAEQLGMSRTHVSALLDSGEVPSREVSGVRVVRPEDVAELARRREVARGELAGQFARQDAMRAAAERDMLALL